MKAVAKRNKLSVLKRVLRFNSDRLNRKLETITRTIREKEKEAEDKRQDITTHQEKLKADRYNHFMKPSELIIKEQDVWERYIERTSELIQRLNEELNQITGTIDQLKSERRKLVFSLKKKSMAEEHAGKLHANEVSKISRMGTARMAEEHIEYKNALNHSFDMKRNNQSG